MQPRLFGTKLKNWARVLVSKRLIVHHCGTATTLGGLVTPIEKGLRSLPDLQLHSSWQLAYRGNP
jgi:hypothetical protein